MKLIRHLITMLEIIHNAHLSRIFLYDKISFGINERVSR